MRPLPLLITCATLWCATLWAQSYTGPIPPKADVPYLLHASNLVETETQQANQEEKKNETTFWINGESSPARTPLAEPIFIIKAEKLRPESIELYRFDVRNRRRELTLKNSPKDGDAHPLHVNVTKLGDNLYKVEASEVLENGEYSLSPNGTNAVFTFQVY
jgi:hypothetical protein